MQIQIQNKVLKSNGVYTRVQDIRVGDLVLNMYGKPVKISRVQQVNINMSHSFINIKHNNWFNVSQLLDETNVLTWNKARRTAEWIQANYFSTCNESIFVLPSKIDWTLPETFSLTYKQNFINPSYGLGFLFGAYLRVGYQRDMYNLADKTTNFHCDTSKKEIINSIKHYSKSIFDVDAINKKQTFIIDLNFQDDDFTDFFDMLNINSSKKRLPLYYLCNNKEYITGIHDGIRFSGTEGHPGIHDQYLKELLYWTFLYLEKPFSYGQLQQTFNNYKFMTTRAILHSIDRKPNIIFKFDVDCPTGSFIMNNMVIRYD